MTYWSISVFFIVVIVGVAVITNSDDSLIKPQHQDAVHLANTQCVQGCLTRVDFPDGTRMIFDNPQTKGWCQIGLLPIDVSDAMKWLSEYMDTRKFRRTHTAGQENRILSEWINDKGEKRMWMLWPANGKTGFSWGNVK